MKWRPIWRKLSHAKLCCAILYFFIHNVLKFTEINCRRLFESDSAKFLIDVDLKCLNVIFWCERWHNVYVVAFVMAFIVHLIYYSVIPVYIFVVEDQPVVFSYSWWCLVSEEKKTPILYRIWCYVIVTTV